MDLTDGDNIIDITIMMAKVMPLNISAMPTP